MNKVEAIKAMLDGKVVQYLANPSARYRYDGAAFVTVEGYVAPNVNNWDCGDGYELYVEPPKEVTRVEAWAALGDGKVVRLVPRNHLLGEQLVRYSSEGALEFSRAGGWQASAVAFTRDDLVARYYIEPAESP